MQTFYKICLILMIIGGINWGLVGLFQFDFVGWLLGGSSSIWSRIVFTLWWARPRSAASRVCFPTKQSNAKTAPCKKRPLAREPFFLCHFILLPSRQDRAG